MTKVVRMLGMGELLTTINGGAKKACLALTTTLVL